MEKYKIIGSKNIDLCVTLEEYFPLFLEWVNDIESCLLIGRIPPFNREDEKKWLQKYQRPSNDKAFTIFQASKSKPSGIVSLDNVDLINRSAEIGILMGKDIRGKRYGEEVFQLIAEYGFYVMNLHSLYGKAYSFNTAMLHIGRKFGAKDTGILREAHYVAGKYYDVILQDLLAQDYERLNLESVIKNMVKKSEKKSTYVLELTNVKNIKNKNYSKGGTKNEKSIN